MYINRKLLNYIFGDDQTYYGSVDEYKTGRQSLGGLVITKGRLMIGDPYAINLGNSISADLADGLYAAQAITFENDIDQEVRVAALLVNLSAPIEEKADKDQDPVIPDLVRPDTWHMCLPKDVKEEDLARDAYYGLSTESGNVTICAEQTVDWLVDHVEESAEVLKNIEDEIGESYFTAGGISNVHLPEMRANLITVVAGTDKGVFPAYLGYKDGKPVCLALDFLMAD